ncbi:TIGR03086 family protein [Microbispora sp. RL4-1S]|uniref:TIGR03086 family protein n=1 Tax=Microbispora oryzae TaxID=2806554 RepID=A0A941ASG8_9ACTN|nr:TIGR03086 family metal-binding protein [Microbispora oryzae]MBP2708299.1 TIGR03086 family protein [Microbispora oryzae]
MIDIRDAYRRALDGFGSRLHLVQDDQWELPTPCVDWDVRGLVNHVVVENLWAPELLGGRAAAEMGDAFDGDVLGDDPVKAFEVSAQGAIQAVYAEGALTAVTRLSFGDVVGEEYITELFADVLIHTWDLARATGGPERLDPQLVASCADWSARTQEDYPQAEPTGDGHRAWRDTDQQDRLLSAWGRNP